MTLKLGLTTLGVDEGDAQGGTPTQPTQAILLLTDRNEILSTESGDQLMVDTDHGQ